MLGSFLPFAHCYWMIRWILIFTTAIAVWAALPTVLAQPSPVPSGGLDTTWGAGGSRVIRVGGPVQVVDSVVAADGSIFTLGTISNAPGTSVPGFVVAKVSPTGAVAAFGLGGFATTTFGNTPIRARVIALQGNKVLVAGVAEGNSYGKWVVKRFLSTGEVDTSFASVADDSAAVVTPESYGYLYDMAVRQDGDILLLGSSSYGAQVVCLYGGGGGLSDNFGLYHQPGRISVNVGVSGFGEIKALSGGYIMVSGIGSSYGSKNLRRIRLKSGGAVDTTFGVGGVVESGSVTMSGAIGGLSDLGGNVVLLGGYYNDYYREYTGASLSKVSADGQVETTFGSNGVATPMSSYSSNTVYYAPAGVAQRSDGRCFLGAGDVHYLPAFKRAFYLTRVGPDGEPDLNFTTTGRASAVIGDGAAARGLCSLPDGRYVVFGHQDVPDSTNDGIAWAAFNPGPLVTDDVAPVVTGVPVSQTVNRGTKVSLSVAVQPGNALKPWCRWKRNGTVVSVGTKPGPVLTFNSVEAVHEGDYTVEVGNMAGSTLVTGFSLTVIAPPAVIIPPVGYTGPHGITRELSVTAAGRTPLTYQWQKDSENLGLPVTTDALTSKISVLAEPENDGEYRVIITNSEGSVTSVPVTLKALAGQPTLVGSWGGLYEYVADPEEGTWLSLKVTGAPPFTFQWQKDGKNFESAVTNSTGVAGLSLPRSISAQGGYRCIITNMDGTLTTEVLTVKGWPHPTVRQNYARLLLREGEELYVTTRTFSRTEPTGFQWLHNGKNAATTTEPAYHVPNVALRDAGGYRLRLKAGSVSCLSDETSVAVVQGRPMTTLLVGKDKTATFTIKTSGNGLSYRWQRSDGEPLPLGCTGITTATLRIPRVSTGATGDYTCIVSRTGIEIPIYADGFELIVVPDKAQVMVDEELPPGAVGRPYEYAPYIIGFPSRIVAGDLPTGLTCHPTTGVISGIPKVGGNFVVKLVITNAAGTTAPVLLPLAITPLQTGALGSFSGPIDADWSGEYGDVPFGTLSLAISTTGTYTGRLAFSAGSGRLLRASFTGQWGVGQDLSLNYPHDYESTSTAFVMPAPNAQAGVGRARIHLTWSPTGGVVGELTFTDRNGPHTHAFTLYQNGWNARTHPATAASGYYTMEAIRTDPLATWDLDSTGSGCASCTVSKGGTFTLAGHLPDGTAFVVPAFMTADGYAWIFTWLHGYRGFLYGGVTITPGTAGFEYLNGKIDGYLWWQRPPSTIQVTDQAVDNTYFNGLDATFHMVGARYLAPGRSLVGYDASMLMMNTRPESGLVTVTMAGGGLDDSLRGLGMLSASHRVTNGPDVAGNDLTFVDFRFNPTTGVFVGTAAEPAYARNDSRIAGPRIANFRGIVTRANPLSPEAYGAGYFTRSKTWTLESYDLKPPRSFPVLNSGRIEVNPEE